MDIKNIPDKELFAPGHSACAGCGAPMVVRYVLKVSGENTIVCNATGCLEVFSTPYPRTSWKVPWIHAAFENVSALASGVEAAISAKKKNDKYNIVCFGGDGSTFDIGFGSLSGMLERGHKILYVCYDNEAYMNTGIQRSGATPKYANTTTTPAGKAIPGKQEFTKPLPFIVAAHGAYVATANVCFPYDLMAKVKKALAFDGPSYIQVFSPCPTGWKHPTELSIDISKLAFNTNIYPLYEIENSILKLSRKPAKVTPVKEYLQRQGRFKHMDETMIKDVQDRVDKDWNRLLKLEESGLELF